MTTQGNRAMIDSILTDVRSSWQAIDDLFGSLGPKDWAQPHGPDWTMADPPFHLAYFDKEILVDGIEKGPDLPREQQHVWRNFRELNEWNVRKFAERSSGQTPQQSVEQMQATREALLNVTSSMTDGDLDRPVFIPICGCGWLNAGMALNVLRAHTWNHATELKLRLGESTPTPSGSCTHNAVGMYQNIFAMFANKEEAAKAKLTAVLEFTGPGGGSWTVRVDQGAITVAEEHAQPADLVMTQSTDTFVKMITGIADPMSLIQSGDIKVQGMEHMPTYGAVFAPPDPDRIIEPMSPPAA